MIRTTLYSVPVLAALLTAQSGALACGSYGDFLLPPTPELASSPTLPAGWLPMPSLTIVAVAPLPPVMTNAPDAPAQHEWVFAVEPKPLSEQVMLGVQWILGHQLDGGGWGQGEESIQMGGGGAMKGKANVADTCVALLTLIRAGGTPSDGPFALPIYRGLSYLFDQIEAAPSEGLTITDVQGTRVQGKLGPYIDTFLTSVVLPEVKGEMPDATSEARLASALGKVLNKIAQNQKQDGTWDNNGWAPVLAQSMAAKGMGRASQVGVQVDEDAMRRIEEYSKNQVQEGGGFAGPGAAGIALYAGAANLSTLQDSANSNDKKENEWRDIAQSADASEDVREHARQELKRIADTRVACDNIQASLVDKLNDPAFVAGFGSNGGEEFLSYMNIAESLVLKGGDDWARWDDGMSRNLNRIQNKDGSWTGHHCITGKNFCTASALLVLMADRTPVPAEAVAKAE